MVVDAGFVADAPSGQTPPADEVSCVTVPSGSTGSQALSAAGTITEQNGLVCAIDGFPANECSAEITDAEASAAAQAAASESPNPAQIGAEAAADPASDCVQDPAGWCSGSAWPRWSPCVLGIVVTARRRSSGSTGE